jgi:hypothetical protein
MPVAATVGPGCDCSSGWTVEDGAGGADGADMVDGVDGVDCVDVVDGETGRCGCATSGLASWDIMDDGRLQYRPDDVSSGSDGGPLKAD